MERTADLHQPLRAEEAYPIASLVTSTEQNLANGIGILHSRSSQCSYSPASMILVSEILGLNEALFLPDL
jgi:hypothetical protein